MTQHRIGLLAFDDCDAMDLIGPYEVLLTANRLLERGGEDAAFEVLVIGEQATVFGGLEVTPTVHARDAGDLAVLIVPGAIDITTTAPDAVLALLAPQASVVASVCTGAFFLQRAGLIGDLPVTTHWEDLDALAATGATVRSGVRWVDSGPLVTSGGISSGIAMALHLLERFASRGLAEATARQIDYVWTESRG